VSRRRFPDLLPPNLGRDARLPSYTRAAPLQPVLQALHEVRAIVQYGDKDDGLLHEIKDVVPPAMTRAHVVAPGEDPFPSLRMTRNLVETALARIIRKEHIFKPTEARVARLGR